LKAVFNTVWFRKSVTEGIPKKDLLSREPAERFDHAADVGNGFCRGAEKREQTFPGVLPDQSHPSVFLNRQVKGWIPINLFQHRFDIFIQAEKGSKKIFFNSLGEKHLLFLPEQEDPIAGLNMIRVRQFGIAKKLAALQSILEGKGGYFQPKGHSFLLSGKWRTQSL
jgi:hypothetical protein